MDKDFINRFIDLDTINVTAIDNKAAKIKARQKRGSDFQELLLDVFEKEEILIKRNKHTSDNKSEEIDGVIEVYNRLFLVEAKWRSSNIAASELYAFIGKIENKFQGALGVFISRSALRPNFLNALNKGRRQSVIAIHGDDIDAIFDIKSKFKFDNYIKTAFRELSANNLVHYPVSEYLKKINISRRAVKVVQELILPEVTGLDFIQHKLLKVKLSRNEMLVELAKLNEEEKYAAFKFIFENFRKLWFGNLIGETAFIVQNINEFTDLYVPDDEKIKSLAPIYYNKLIPTSLEVYSNSYFIEMFTNHYSSMEKHDREAFEAKIVDLWRKHFGQYTMENNITDVIEPIWDNISEQAKETLYRGYLDIYISLRTNNHSQKKFSHSLIKSEKIPKKILNQWLTEKIKASSKMYKSLDEQKIAFIVSSYRDIFKLISGDEREWISFVQNILFTTKKITKNGEVIELINNEGIQIADVRSTNGANLISSNICIDVIHYSSNGSLAKQSYSLISFIKDPMFHKDGTKIPIRRAASNKGYRKTEIVFYNLESNKIEVKFRIFEEV